MIEVMEEEELANMRAHQEQFIQMRAAEIAEAQRMEEAERRRYEEKERRAAQVARLFTLCHSIGRGLTLPRATAQPTVSADRI